MTPAELAGALVGPHFGVVEALESIRPEPDDPTICVYAGRLADTSAFAPVGVPRLASGAGLDAPEALGACLGEAVERYSAGLAAPGTIVSSRLSGLEGKAVSPAAFALFSARQYRRRSPDYSFVPWQEEHSIGWVRARSLALGDEVWVPAALVHQPYRPFAGEPLLAPSLSTGLACGRDAASAAAAGLCEVIERDAVSLAWLGCASPPRIVFDLDELPDAAGRLVEAFQSMGFRWSAFDLTTDLAVPVAAVLLEGHSPVGWITAFGSACHGDRGRALTKALLEAAHCRLYVKALLRSEPGWRAGRRCENVRSFGDHARFYSVHPDRRRPIDRWLDSPRESAWSFSQKGDENPDAWLRRAAQDLQRAGHEPLAVPLTTPDMAPLGLHVVRVLVPGLQPLHGDHHWPHLGGRRLRQLRRVFGPAARQPWRWNPSPHPCP